VIVCGHSKIERQDGGFRIRIDGKVGSALNLFPGQILFGAGEEDTGRFFLSPIRLNPNVSYFRVFLEDIRGSLASITRLFSDRGINILSGGAFGFGNIWVSEFVADFRDVDATADSIVNEIESLGGFVTSMEITELFPRAFELKSTYEIKSDSKGMYLLLDGLPRRVSSGQDTHAVLKAWPQMQALFIDFIPSENRLLKISAELSDVPGSLNGLARLLGAQVNLHAIHEQHHSEVSGVWTIYGVLEVGSIDELKEKAMALSTIRKFEVEPLGWES